MPTDLAALLVDAGAVSADVVERALARQREAGGALDTALLEERAIAEDALVGWLARAAELPAAPETAWSGDDARARRVFPSRVAERHGLAPFALDGRELALVATYPVDLGLLDEISFMLSLHLTAHVGPEWRVRHLIHRMYGSPLSPRLAALAAAAGAGGAEPGAGEQDARGGGGATTVAAAPRTDATAGFARDASEPLEPLAAALAQALESVESFAFEDLSDVEDEAAAASGGPPDDEDQPSPAPPVAADRSAPPRWTIDAARAAVAAARHRDEVVLAALRYARDFFDFAAMFAVTRDAVAGHDALGEEGARERARDVAIWSSDPGIFRTVIETKSPYLGPVAPGAAGTDAVLHGLGRTPRTVLVYPVTVRDRPVCILYADNGDAPVSPGRLGDLLLFLSALGTAFERIIKQRKGGSRRRAAEDAAPAGPPRGEAAESAPVTGPASSGLAPAPVQAAPDAAKPEEEPPQEEPSQEGPPQEEPPAEEPVADSLAALGGRSFGTVALAAANGAPGTTIAAPPAGPSPAPAPGADAPPVAGPPDPAALAALADRVLDPDPDVASAACAALGARRRDPAVRHAVEKLRRALLSGISARASRAARAIGAVRDVESIPLLIQALETSEPETARAAADALATITLQRLGPDARRWLGWWKENRGRGRAEWLFSGLTSPDRETRVAASVELSIAAPPPVAYSADLPAEDREKAARAWAGWWSRSGHVL